MPVSFLGKIDHFEENWFFHLSEPAIIVSYRPLSIQFARQTKRRHCVFLCFSPLEHLCGWMASERSTENIDYTLHCQKDLRGGVLCHLFRANSWVARNLSKTAGRGGRSIVGLSIILCHWLTLQSCLRADCSPQTSKTAECDSAVLLNAVQWY